MGALSFEKVRMLARIGSKRWEEKEEVGGQFGGHKTQFMSLRQQLGIVSPEVGHLGA
jgi:hypothetical protein